MVSVVRIGICIISFLLLANNMILAATKRSAEELLSGTHGELERQKPQADQVTGNPVQSKDSAKGRPLAYEQKPAANDLLVKLRDCHYDVKAYGMTESRTAYFMPLTPRDVLSCYVVGERMEHRTSDFIRR